VSGYVIQEIVGLTGWLGEKKQEGEKSESREQNGGDGTRGEWMSLGESPGGLEAVESAFWSWDPGWLWFLVGKVTPLQINSPNRPTVGVVASHLPLCVLGGLASLARA
jgi:hypothetical protein